MGTCGRVLEGAEMKTLENTNEICLRGRHIFMGYKDMLEANEASIDDEGWYHTGDTGIIDKDGFLVVKGRIKELIITAVNP